MNIEAFLICDAATDTGGKLNVLGAFDTIFVSELPATHPQCAIVLRMRLARSEHGEHRIALHLIDSDGQHVIKPLEGNFRVSSNSGATATSNLILNLQGLALKSDGELAVHLHIDGKHVASLPLYIRKLGPPVANN